MKKTLICLIVTFVLSLNLGMRFTGNPGDCVAPDDSSFASLDGGCKDLATGRVWSGQPDTQWSLESANSYCISLVEGGQSDWRLPTVDELRAVYGHGGLTHLALTQQTPYNWSDLDVLASLIVRVAGRGGCR